MKLDHACIRRTTLPTVLVATLALAFALALPAHAQSRYPTATDNTQSHPAIAGQPTNTRVQATPGARSGTPVLRPMQPIAQGAYPTAVQTGSPPGAAPMPQSGPYQLTMTATQVNGHPPRSHQALSQDVSVSWNGATLLIDTGGLTLQGQVTNNHLAVSSQGPDGTLTLSGTPAARSASGTFSLAQTSGTTASGRFTLALPQPKHFMRNDRPVPVTGGCQGDMSCRIVRWLISLL